MTSFYDKLSTELMWFARRPKFTHNNTLKIAHDETVETIIKLVLDEVVGEDEVLRGRKNTAYSIQLEACNDLRAEQRKKLRGES